MNRAVSILAPPIVFVLAAALAGFSGAPGGINRVDPELALHRPLHGDVENMDCRGLNAALSRLERNILPDQPAPHRQCRDAVGINLLLEECDPFSGVSAYASRWAEDSPHDMLIWLVRQDETRIEFSRILFKEWAKSDVEAALAAVPRIPNTRLRAQALLTTLEVLCQNDMKRAREELLKPVGPFLPDWSGEYLFDGNCGRFTWYLFLALPEGRERTLVQAKLLASMYSICEPQDLWNQASEFRRREWFDAGFSSPMGDADAFDGLGGLMRERAEATGAREDVEKFLDDHGKTWARRDLAAALGWSGAHLKGVERVRVRRELFEVGAGDDFDTTLRIWKDLPDGYQKKSIADAMLRAVPDARKAEARAALQPIAE